MYLNVNIASGAGDAGTSVPRTPEILSLLTGGPFDHVSNFKTSSTLLKPAQRKAPIPGESCSFGWDSASMSSDASTSSPGTPGTPSVRNARTFLIKEGLKLTIQNKRLANGKQTVSQFSDQIVMCKTEELTQEDEERRKRRRERNKLAATKCRNRKKEKTGLLISESDILEDQNVKMRNEIQNLEEERRRLVNALATHTSSCVKAGNSGSPHFPESSSSYFPPTSCTLTTFPSSHPSVPFTLSGVASSHPSGQTFRTERDTVLTHGNLAGYSPTSSVDYYDTSPSEHSCPIITFHQL